MDRPPRFLPTRPLPDARYVPGRTPRPEEDSRPPARPRTVDGPFHPDYLYACDLYNAGYFWEAHEEWEEQWRRCPPRSSARLVLQGLIQAAAAWLKEEMGDPRNAARLQSLAAEKLTRASPDGPRILGLDIEAFAVAVASRPIGVRAAHPTLTLSDRFFDRA